MSDKPQTIVIDNGTGNVKAGFGGETVPRTIFPSMVGRPKKQKYILKGMNMKEVYVGREASRKKGILKTIYPLAHGVVTDWDDMTELWDYTFTQRLRINPLDQTVLLTEPPLNPKKNREKMAEIMFENFGISDLYLSIQGILALYQCGRTTGITLDIGDGVCHIVPIYETYAMSHGIERLDLAGRDLTNYLVRQLLSQGYSFRSNSEKETVRDIKEKLCYVAQNYEHEVKKADKGDCDKEYVLPDGKSINIHGKCLFETAESLFKPNLCGLESTGIHEKLKSSVEKCDIDVRRDFYGNVILSGGTTMWKGFESRLKTEIEAMIPSSVKVQIFAKPERKFAVWLGGSIVAELSQFKQMCLNKFDYDENPRQVHSRFF